MSEENEKASLEFAGIKFTGGKMFAIITALTTLVGGLYGGFEIYKDYMDMKEQIQSYVAPDLTGFQEQLSVMEEKLKSAEDSVIEARDYTRDIKNDLKTDIDRLEGIVDDMASRIKTVQTESRDAITTSEKVVRELIDLADQRFENKRDRVEQNTDQAMKELEERLDTKVQMALDNPLAN
jgi:hypothetical protein